MTATQTMPVLFLGHGNPMNAIEDNAFHRNWQALGKQLPRPTAILCISAHWETRGVQVTASARPETIHDFYGFPQALFDVQYPAPGAPWLARRIIELLADVQAVQDPVRGLDHGAWSVLMPMYPNADIPILQLSLDTREPGVFHYNLARRLAPLRDEGVLIVGSGNIVHNLRLLDFRDPAPLDWATRFNDQVRLRLQAHDHAGLVDFMSLGPDARLAIPTPEHYLPLLYAIALQRDGEPLAWFNDQVQGSISMTSLVIGESAPGILQASE